MCAVSQGTRVHHGLWDCLQQGREDWQGVQASTAIIQEEVFAKRQLEKYAGCFWCRLL